MTPTTTNAGRLPGETDDRAALARRHADELRLELAAKGGPDELLAALRGPDRSRYRAAVNSAARALLNYSGHGYPEAGVEGYGPAFDVTGVELEDYELARRIIDEVDLIAVERGLDEVVEAMRAAGNYTFPPQHRRAVALELVARRRAR